MQGNSIDLLDTPATKFCKQCEQDLPLEDFHLMRRGKHRPYRQSWCKDCNSRKCSEWLQSPKGRRYQRRRNLASRFNITPADYERMFVAQGGVCFVCKKPETRNFKGRVCPLAIDHDHATGKIRALLCHACNKALGFSNDDSSLLRLLADYIDGFH